MATQQPPDAGTAVTTRKRELPAHQQAQIDDVRARNMMVAAIRGTQWGNNLSHEVQRSIAEYCRQNNLDPVRHVEILGGRIYLTAELYDEKGAHLIREGIVRPDEPDFIHADERLETLASDGDEWAKEERTRRLRLRIEHGVPEPAKAAVIQRFRITGTDTTILGVNWCGGVRQKTKSGSDADPIGEAEPTKTALTRARRRAWKQIADIIPGYAEIMRPIEATAKLVNEALPVQVVAAPEVRRALASVPNGDAYGREVPAAESAQAAVDDELQAEA